MGSRYETMPQVATAEPTIHMTYICASSAGDSIHRRRMRPVRGLKTRMIVKRMISAPGV